MRFITTPEHRLGLESAVRLMSEALAVLDELDAPGEIGSMLDLAVARLEKFRDQDDQAMTGVKAMMCQLEEEFAAAAATAPCSDSKPNPWALGPL